MIYGKAGHGWLHHKTEESICLPLDSEEYEEKLEDGWQTSRTFESLDELDESLDEQVTYEELKAKAKELGIKGYGSMKPETLINRIKELS